MELILSFSILVNIAIPLIGILIYFKLAKRITKKKINKPPILDLFFILMHYGVVLFMILIAFFEKSMGSLIAPIVIIMFYLILVAPIIMAIIAYIHYRKRQLSKYHIWVYSLSLFYVVIMPLLLIYRQFF